MMQHLNLLVAVQSEEEQMAGQLGYVVGIVAAIVIGIFIIKKIFGKKK